MAVVLIVRPWGLFGKPEAAARRTPGLTVNPWRPLTSGERLLSLGALVAAAMLPLFAGNYALTVGSEIAIFVIFAASLHFLMSVGGLASFGHAAYFGLGAYGVAFLAKAAGLPMIVSLLLGPLLGLLGAAVFGFFAVQLSGVYFAMLTLAFAQIVWSIAFQWVAVTGGDNGILGVWPDKWAAGPASFYWLSLGIAALAVTVLRVIVFSPFGFALRATRDSPLRSEAIGINGKRVQWTAFVISGTVAGIGGALFAYLKGSVFPDSLGISLSVDALVMVLLGGVETVSGAVDRRHRVQGAQHLAGQPDRSFEAGARRLHRADGGGVPEGHRRHAGDDLESPAILRRQEIRARSPPASRSPNEHGPHIAVGREPQQILWRRPCRAQRVLRTARGRNPGADRPQRRGQEHLLRHAQRPEHAGQRPHHAARRGHRRPEAARGLAARRRAHLPDHGDVPDHDGARERAGRAGVVWHGNCSISGARRASYAREEAGRLLDLVGMGAYAGRPCGELAYGDLKRLELAIALANQPKLLLMDEPTAGMAPRERIELMRLTARIAREQSIGVLFTEHDMDVVFEHADRILVLNRGSLIAEGSPEEVRGNPQVRAIYLGEGLVYDARHREGAGA